MLARYSSSAGAGALVTAALIYWMQLMIADGDFATAPAHRVHWARPIITEPPPPRVRPARPNPPEPRPFKPDMTSTRPDPPTARPVIVGPDTPPGPPSPSDPPGGRSGPESRGPWATDSDLLLVAEILPAYPYSALQRELEGRVIVEFTVTRRGEVTDARVVESTDRIFESPAVRAISKARYRPRVVDGAPMEVRGLRKEIAFTLTD